MIITFETSERKHFSSKHVAETGVRWFLSKIDSEWIFFGASSGVEGGGESSPILFLFSEIFQIRGLGAELCTGDRTEKWARRPGPVLQDHGPAR